jgi:hypothetical protein
MVEFQIEDVVWHPDFGLGFVSVVYQGQKMAVCNFSMCGMYTVYTNCLTLLFRPTTNGIIAAADATEILGWARYAAWTAFCARFPAHTPSHEALAFSKIYRGGLGTGYLPACPL